MPLDPSDLAALSRLLNEALDLAPAQVEGWLEALPEQHRHLVPKLRDVLAAHATPGRATSMSWGPKLTEGEAQRQWPGGLEHDPLRCIALRD